MRNFCKFPDFRRELILSELPSSFVVNMINTAIEESCWLPSDIVFIAVNRNFSEAETECLQKFKYKLLLYDFKNKKEIIKIFYKNSDFGEKDDAISQKLIEIFSDDLDFICWLASKGSSPVLKKAFIKHVATGEQSREKFEKLKFFVRKQSFSDCDFEENGYSEYLLDIRQYLTRAEDIEAWERYLLNSNTTEVINLNIRRFGVESKESLKRILEMNDNDIIASYRFHYSQIKKG